MAINEYKIKHLSEKVQVVLFDRNGQVVDSCDTLMDMNIPEGSTIFDLYPLIDSIKEDLFNQGGSLHFPRIELNYEGNERIYDFTFYKVNTPPNVTLWIIQDLTPHYRYLMNIQQERNEAIIKDELLEAKTKAISLQKTVESLNKMYKLKVLHFAQIAHDIKIPVREINGITYLLEEHVQEEGKQYLDTLRNASNNLNSMLQNAINFSKINLGRIEGQETEFILSELLWTVVKTFDYQIVKRKIPIYINIAPDIPKQLKGYSLQLSQIFYNLISNALKYTNEGSINVHAVKAKEQKDPDKILLHFCVEHTGIGIPKEKQTAIFNPFAQIQNKNNQSPLSGVGLGLYIVKQLVENAHGSVSIESTVGKGTSLSFTFPFQIKD